MEWKRLAAAAAAALAIMLAACSNQATDQAPSKNRAQETRRIVTLGGDVTETAFALGFGDEVVGTDRGSLYPPRIHELPRLDYHRQMSAEGILSLDPTIVLLTAEAGPPTAIEQLVSAGVEIITIPNEPSTSGAEEKIRAVASALEADAAAAEFLADWRTKLEEAKSLAESYEAQPSVLFLYSRPGLGAPMVGGSGTPADVMITLAGGTNAAAAINDFRPLTPEALLDLNSDVVLMLDKGFETVGGVEGLMALPGMGETSAGKSGRFVHLPDDLMLTFGPRLPEAITRLAEAIHNTPAERGG